ncbi:hypothetical protein N7528_008375 [Penicillium herquei]|nr:hypothetical protein N7528_008375 [Penicillium herquei]
MNLDFVVGWDTPIPGISIMMPTPSPPGEVDDGEEGDEDSGPQAPGPPVPGPQPSDAQALNDWVQALFHQQSSELYERQLMMHRPCWEALMHHFRHETHTVSIDLLLLASLLQIPTGKRGSRELARELMGIDAHTPDFSSIDSRIERYFPQGALRDAMNAFPRTDPILDTQAVQGRLVSNTDCFSRLPPELRQMVACHLPTRDMLHLRLASRAMAPVFHERTFWKSRFKLHEERGYMNCFARNDFPHSWMMVYHCSKRPARGNEPRCLITEQWARYEIARERYFLSPDLGPSTTSTDRVQALHWQIVMDASYQTNGINQRWKIVRNRPNNWPVSRTETVTVDTSEDILGIAVFAHSWGSWSEITGFELIYGTDRPNVILGHRLQDMKVIINLSGKTLRGFEVKAGAGCIRAIRPIILGTPEEAYQWIGNPNYTPARSFRIVTAGRVEALTGEFAVSQRTDHSSCWP